jgi:class 3 adenylate cyclase
VKNSSSKFLRQRSVVLFADVCDSMRLFEAVGDAAAHASIANCLDMLRDVTDEYRGRVVKTLGDGLMAVFPDAASGTMAACEMQIRVAMLPPLGNVRIALRIGCNYGPVLTEADEQDVFGDTVNVAARLRGFARPGQIIATLATLAELPALHRVGTRRLESIHVKGKAEAIPVVELLWDEADDATLIASRSLAAPRSRAKLLLIYGSRTLTMDDETGVVTIGRDPVSSLPVEVPTASRRHGRIESRASHFIYTDLSTNGSFVTVRGEPELRLLHEEMILRGTGWISLGQRFETAPGLAVAYVCQYLA